MEEKYYTPKLEEFHVGFEYEVYNNPEKYFLGGDEKWMPQIHSYGILSDILHLHKLISDKQIRVKFLNGADIESLGFRKQLIPDVFFDDDELIDGFRLTINESTSIFVNLENNILQIARQDIYNQDYGNWTATMLFEGVIKNKSELKKLLTQLGITIK